MSNSHDTNDTDSNRTLTRRRALAAVAGTAATGLGVTAVATDTADAQADIQLGALSIADGTHAAPDPTPSPIVETDARLVWSAETVDRVETTLGVGPSDSDTEAIATDTIDALVSDGDTTRTLSGAVTDADAYTSGDFAPERESTIRETLTVALGLAIEHEGETLATDRVTDTATVTVENTADAVSVELGGDGVVTFDADE